MFDLSKLCRIGGIAAVCILALGNTPSNRTVFSTSRISSNGVCVTDTTSPAGESGLGAVRRLLNATDARASAFRSQLYLPSVAGASITVVSDSLICAAVRTKQDSVLTNNFMSGIVRPDSLRPILVLRVDTVLVVGDIDGNRRTGASGMGVYRQDYMPLARFR